MSVRSSLPSLAGLLLITSLVLAPSAAARVECRGVPNCTSVAGPWVAVPAAQQPDEYEANWGANCPINTQIAGTDWASTTPFSIAVFVEQLAGITIYGQGAGADFIASNATRKPTSFQPLLGCQQLNAARPAQAGALQRRVSERRLRPSRTHRFRHACRSGERLVRSATGVAFFEDEPPTVAELGQVEVRRAERRDSVRVRVNTGAAVGDDERVIVQIHAVCRR